MATPSTPFLPSLFTITFPDCNLKPQEVLLGLDILWVTACHNGHGFRWSSNMTSTTYHYELWLPHLENKHDSITRGVPLRMSICKTHSPVRGTEQTHNIHFSLCPSSLASLYSSLQLGYLAPEGLTLGPSILEKIELDRSLQWVDKDCVSSYFIVPFYPSTAVRVDAPWVTEWRVNRGQLQKPEFHQAHFCAPILAELLKKCVHMCSVTSVMSDSLQPHGL